MIDWDKSILDILTIEVCIYVIAFLAFVTGPLWWDYVK